ncbi:Na(+)/H(+) antiporter subunit C [Nesterenkonia natronophila]|uniref:Na(+)/H(+) antiporter subunit C n=1 Tax=Nesterenkonia natronophila TaxID=2174932 RepID=A0A3A4F4H2_9MICC|nr:Na(+)/H(+) antiporter subunit C [Nesterenkonia natronophila]RJN32706.1 Na(+)/H(+) antiporter subunit C [Nesterenkonia natronophila]
MTVNLTLLVVMGAMLAIGIYLILERSLTRVLLGIILISNGVNLLILQTSGRAGESPIVRDGLDSGDYLDPLPQALLLTAIVIAFAMVALLLALIYRSWVLARQDEVTDDEEDRRVATTIGARDPEEDDDVSTETSEFIDAVDPATGTTRTVSPAERNSESDAPTIEDLHQAGES